MIARRGAATGRRRGRGVLLACLAASIVSCGLERRTVAPTLDPVGTRVLIDKALPRSVPDRAGWTDDIYAGFSVLEVAATRSNVCAVAAVIEQESGFQVDPVIAKLPAIAWRAIDERAAAAGVPTLVVRGVLEIRSPTGVSYGHRIDHVKTERELSDIFEDFVDAVPMGRTLFADHNPIRTRGPMQVQTQFAAQFSERHPYPYPVKTTLADEVFTRRGGIYFGTAHLLDYAADYDRYLFRFADFNAGQYSSRNAAFQLAVGIASGVRLVADGALLPREADAKGLGATELASRVLGPRLKLDNTAIHATLEKSRSAEFDSSALYARVYDLAERTAGHSLPRAALPRIDLHGPKISRKLTTEWYATRVDERFHRCMAR